MVEEVTQDHVPVVPAFARSVAFDLRSVYEGSPVWNEPPTDIDDVVRRPSVKTADMMSIADAVAADQQLCRSLKVKHQLCASAIVEVSCSPDLRVLELQIRSTLVPNLLTRGAAYLADSHLFSSGILCLSWTMA